MIALWSEEAVQHELNTMYNKKIVWAKISQGMAKTKVSACLTKNCLTASVVAVSVGVIFFF